MNIRGCFVFFQLHCSLNIVKENLLQKNLRRLYRSPREKYVIYSNTSDLESLSSLDLRWPSKTKGNVSSRETASWSPGKPEGRERVAILKQLDLVEKRHARFVYISLLI